MLFTILLLIVNFQSPQHLELERIKIGDFMTLDFPANSLEVDTLVISGQAIKLGNSIIGAYEIVIDSMTNIQDINNFNFTSQDSLRLFYDVCERKLRASTRSRFIESQNILIDSLEGRMVKFENRTIYYVFGKNKLYQLLFELNAEDQLENLESELLGSIDFNIELTDQYRVSSQRSNWWIYLVTGTTLLFIVLITTKRKNT